VGLPKEIGSVSGNQFVVRVIRVGIAEWWVARIQNEKNYSKSEKINHMTLVRFFQKNFWGHVGLSTQKRSKEAAAISALDWGSESKICDLNVELVIKHDVFGF
jgi:hypothetical protein